MIPEHGMQLCHIHLIWRLEIYFQLRSGKTSLQQSQAEFCLLQRRADSMSQVYNEKDHTGLLISIFCREILLAKGYIQHSLRNGKKESKIMANVMWQKED